MRSWVVALEVGEDPDGPGLDAGAMARRMDAVADIRPAGRGHRRHSFLLRLDGKDPSDAVVTAVTRFRDAAVGGGALLGARVVRSASGLPGVDGRGSSVRRAVLRPRLLVAVALALIGVAALLAVVTGTGISSGRVRPTPDTQPVAESNLLPNASFEVTGAKTKGLAKGLTAWGAVRASLVEAPVQSGQRAQQIEVATGQMGGVWFDVAAVAGRPYRQSAWLDVRELSPGSRVEMILEWYGSSDNLLGYQALPLTSIDAGYVQRTQTVTAPPGTQRTRFLVNFTGGGRLLIDDADLRTAPSQVKT